MHLRRLVAMAREHGARLICGDDPRETLTTPLVLADVRPHSAIVRSDVFAPVLSLIRVQDEEEALELDALCPYALGASVFGETRAARTFAGRIRAGSVVVNDLIVPTADPRLPFGGRGESGFGVTRGPEGLLEMTTPKSIVVRYGSRRPHLDRSVGGEANLFRAWVKAAHADTWRQRIGGWVELIRAGRALARARSSQGETR
jgi:acyl-CoA reductase-like NAD-dependent aldehyde dehydrogenase